MPTSEASNQHDRLFVPLAAEPYRWFNDRSKRWELRRVAGQYTERQIIPGRRVELRRGYSSRQDALWGTIKEVTQAASIEQFFRQVPFQDVIPVARDKEEAMAMAASILGIDSNGLGAVIGFKVLLDE